MSSALLDTAALADREAAPLAVPLTVCFSVHAAAEPGVMPRVLELFAKRGLVPQTWRSAASDTALTIDVQMSGLEREVTDYIARAMRQIVGVNAVLTTTG